MQIPTPLRYLWPLPWTLFGAALGCLAFVGGGGAQRRDGVLEFWGGALGPGLRLVQAAAITFGHVVLAQSRPMLDATRSHERVHVRQYERWGPAFIPAYLLSSLYQVLRGRRAYWDNPFEVEAYREERPLGEAPPPPLV